MAADTVHVRLATPGQAGPVAELVAAAFHDLPQSQWLVPDAAARPAVLAGVFELAVGHAVTHGVVPTLRDRRSDELVGAAVWLPSTAPDTDWYLPLMAAAAGPSLPRWQAFEDLQHAHHPVTPHHYLMLVAVHPDRQGRGCGTRLLEWSADQLGWPAYLEAATPALVCTYRRFGFTASAPFHLPDDGPPTWPMWRAA